MPCVAKHRLNAVLSTTPGNFFAEYTVNTSLKQAASTGALPWVISGALLGFDGFEAGRCAVCAAGRGDVVPTFTNEKRSLDRYQRCLVAWI